MTRITLDDWRKEFERVMTAPLPEQHDIVTAREIMDLMNWGREKAARMLNKLVIAGSAKPCKKLVRRESDNVIQPVAAYRFVGKAGKNALRALAGIGGGRDHDLPSAEKPARRRRVRRQRTAR